MLSSETNLADIYVYFIVKHLWFYSAEQFSVIQAHWCCSGHHIQLCTAHCAALVGTEPLSVVG